MDAMSPTRALTIALADVIRRDIGAGQVYAMQNPVDAAAVALHLATGAIEHMPKGWGVLSADEVHALEERMTEIEATTRWALASMLMHDGHAKTIADARRMAGEPDTLRQLYPEAFD